jgi:hypothetical protein
LLARQENLVQEPDEVQQVFARYVRAADRRDGAAMSSLFAEPAQVEIQEGRQAPRKTMACTHFTVRMGDCADCVEPKVGGVRRRLAVPNLAR